jgi:prephenate dehydratase
MAKLELYSTVISNKPGKGAQLLNAFKEAGVDFVGIWGYPIGKSKSRIDLVPKDAVLLKKAAKQLKIELGKRQAAFHITGEDHPGAVAETLAKLAAKEINVYAIQALCAGDGRFGAIIQVDQDAVKKATRVLG